MENEEIVTTTPEVKSTTTKFKDGVIQEVVATLVVAATLTIASTLSKAVVAKIKARKAEKIASNVAKTEE